MSGSVKCCRCSKPIQGKIRVDASRRRLGNNSLSEVAYYCQKCFEMLNYERAWNDHKRKEAKNKTTHIRRVRR